MTAYTLTFVVFLLGWAPLAFIATVHLSRMNKRIDTQEAKINIQEAEIRQLWKERRILIEGLCDAGISIKTNALDICRIGDMASDTRAEVAAHARTLDNHADRLLSLEDPVCSCGDPDCGERPVCKEFGQ